MRIYLEDTSRPRYIPVRRLVAPPCGGPRGKVLLSYIAGGHQSRAVEAAAHSPECVGASYETNWNRRIILYM